MTRKIRIAILEDHQATIDGYRYRLPEDAGFEIVTAVTYGEALMPALQAHPVDVLLLDVSAPNSEEDRSPYPVFSLIVQLREQYPELKIIIISMHGERMLIESALRAGVSGYIMKDDVAAIQNLATIIRTVIGGGSHLSQQVLQILADSKPRVQLTPRQIQILSLCAAYPNLTQAEIAKQLNVADTTVRNSLSSAYQRLGVRNLVAAIAKARELGVISPHPSPYQFPGEDDQ